MRRTIVIGDVHGCLDELQELLRVIDVRRDQDHLIFPGDLVDRGPKVNETVRFIHEGAILNGWDVTLGNHEEKHLRWAKHEELRRKVGKKNPMKPFDLQRQVEHEGLSTEEKEWLGSLPAFVRFKDGERNWIATHAGVPSDFPIEDQNIRTLVRTRWTDEKTGAYASTGDPNKIPEGAHYWALSWMGPESIVHGHIVMDEVRIDRQGPFLMTVGIDTGCCFGGKLTAAVFTGKGEPEFVSVPAARVYFEKNKYGQVADE
jgi:bis(5'-nucleosyl)-tetraphosphatase (symmetrical)